MVPVRWVYFLRAQFSRFCWIGIVVLMITAGYTMVGGLRAVVVTDVIQSVLLLASGYGFCPGIFTARSGWLF